MRVTYRRKLNKQDKRFAFTNGYMSIAQNYKRLRQEIPDRPYFKRTRKTFEQIKGLDLPNVDMKYLSMGMTNSYRIAVEEGSNMVRIGTAIFGERRYR